MLYKFEGWHYECEWRFVRATPMVIANHDEPVPTPSHVFLGTRFDPAASKGLLAICRAKNIPIAKMKMADDRFALTADVLAEK